MTRERRVRANSHPTAKYRHPRQQYPAGAVIRQDQFAITSYPSGVGTGLAALTALLRDHVAPDLDDDLKDDWFGKVDPLIAAPERNEMPTDM